MKFLSPRPTGSPLFSSEEVGINANDSTVEMVVESDRYHLLAHSTTNAGTLKHLIVKDSGKMKESIVASPARSLSNFSQRQGVSAALDSNGFPAMAIGMTTGGFLPRSTIMLARPGDSLDSDGDSLPLLLEGAHCYQPSLADAPHSLVSGQTTRGSTFITQSFEYRRPDGFGMALPSGRRYADFDYEFETSTDLKNWNYEEAVTGEIAGILNVDLGSDEREGCIRSSSGFFYVMDTPSVGPMRFGRLRISRAR